MRPRLKKPGNESQLTRPAHLNRTATTTDALYPSFCTVLAGDKYSTMKLFLVPSRNGALTVPFRSMLRKLSQFRDKDVVLIIEGGGKTKEKRRRRETAKAYCFCCLRSADIVIGMYTHTRHICVHIYVLSLLVLAEGRPSRRPFCRLSVSQFPFTSSHSVDHWALRHLL